MQKIQFNIIPFNPVKSKTAFAFYGEDKYGVSSIKCNKLFNEFPKRRATNKSFYYSDFQPAREGAIVRKLDIFDGVYSRQNYPRNLILDYFKSIEGSPACPSFAGNVEVWFEEKIELMIGKSYH